MPSYRLLTSDGPTSMPESIMARLRTKLLAKWEEESSLKSS